MRLSDKRHALQSQVLTLGVFISIFYDFFQITLCDAHRCPVQLLSAKQLLPLQVCMLGSSAIASETLKNLVLPGQTLSCWLMTLFVSILFVVPYLLMTLFICSLFQTFSFLTIFFMFFSLHLFIRQIFPALRGQLSPKLICGCHAQTNQCSN